MLPINGETHIFFFYSWLFQCCIGLIFTLKVLHRIFVFNSNHPLLYKYFCLKMDSINNYPTKYCIIVCWTLLSRLLVHSMQQNITRICHSCQMVRIVSVHSKHDVGRTLGDYMRRQFGLLNILHDGRLKTIYEYCVNTFLISHIKIFNRSADCLIVYQLFNNILTSFT